VITINTKQRFYLIVGLLVFIFCIGYLELAVFIRELSFGAEKVQKAAYIEKDVQKIQQDFWKLRFWEQALQTQSHDNAAQKFGETILQIRQQLRNFNANPFDEIFAGKTEPVNEILKRYENAFNKLVQLETDQRLNQTQIESIFQVLSSTILVSNDYSLLKPLFNLDRFLSRYLRNKTNAEHQALRMVFIFFKKKLKNSDITNERINSYIQKFENLIDSHVRLEKEVHVIHKQFDDFSIELMNSFYDISQIAENIGRQSIENGSHLQKNIYRWMIISVCVSALILLFIIDITAKKVIKPIRMLWSVVMKVQSGDENARFKSKSKDEIAQLGFALNTMLDTINKHRHRLEEIVNERTAELTAINNKMSLEIVQRKKAQEIADKMAIEAEIANKAKSAFLANMSHEIRTPMNAVINMTDLVLETQLTKRQREFLTIIKTSGKGLLGIINDILDLSKIESGKMELEKAEFNLQDSFNSIADMFREKCAQKKLELIINIASNIPPFLIGDPLRLKQVIVNLTNNAIKFTETGEIFIQVMLVNQVKDDVRLAISIKDTGIGISQKSLEKLFAPFSQADNSTTRKYGGTGLGLVICKQIVEMMNGKIWVESTEGRGSIFSFTVTLNKSSIDNDVLEISKIIKNKRALIIDNNLNALTTIDEILQKLGLMTEKANSGREGINILKRSHIIENPFHLILLDTDMPDQNGLDTIKKIKNFSELKSIPVIVMGDLTSEKLYKNFSSAYIAKPIMTKSLVATLEDIFCKKNKPEKSISQDETSVSKRDFSKYSILIVEDNIFNLHVAIEILKQASFTDIGTADNGKKAIEALNLKSYDLILMDIQMPEMDGFQAARLIRKQDAWKDIPIIAMTANALKGDREACLDSGMNDYIAKPINRKEFINKLEQWVLKISL